MPPRISRGSGASGITAGYVLRITLEVCILIYIVVLYHKTTHAPSAHGGVASGAQLLPQQHRSLISNRKAALSSLISEVGASGDLAAALGGHEGAGSELLAALQSELQAGAVNARASANELAAKLARARSKAAASSAGGKGPNLELMAFLGVLEDQIKALNSLPADHAVAISGASPPPPAAGGAGCAQSADPSDVAMYAMHAAGTPCRCGTRSLLFLPRIASHACAHPEPVRDGCPTCPACPAWRLLLCPPPPAGQRRTPSIGASRWCGAGTTTPRPRPSAALHAGRTATRRSAAAWSTAATAPCATCGCTAATRPSAARSTASAGSRWAPPRWPSSCQRMTACCRAVQRARGGRDAPRMPVAAYHAGRSSGAGL